MSSIVSKYTNGLKGDFDAEETIGPDRGCRARALFMDAGNVWLLNNETQRPGGEFRIKGLLKEIALGTGFGLRYDFSYIVVRADLGIPIHAPYSTGKSGYYNIDGSFWKGLVLNLAIGYPF